MRGASANDFRVHPPVCIRVLNLTCAHEMFNTADVVFYLSSSERDHVHARERGCVLMLVTRDLSLESSQF